MRVKIKVFMESSDIAVGYQYDIAPLYDPVASDEDGYIIEELRKFFREQLGNALEEYANLQATTIDGAHILSRDGQPPAALADTPNDAASL